MVHHTVDAKAHVTFVAARLDVNVAGALVERVLQQPVDDVDDVRVVRIGRLQLAEFEHLLEVRDRRHLEARVGRFRDRPRHRVELEHVARQDPAGS